MLGRQLRQPLQHPGPQLQGHPAGAARGAADAGSALRDPRHGSRGQAGSALDVRARCSTTTQPRELKRFQQLNAVRIQGVIPPPVSLDQALTFLETEAKQLLPPGFTDRLRGRVAPAAHRGQPLPRHVPALGHPHLPGAGGAVRELPRPVHHPGGIGAARHLGRAAVLVPRPHHAQHLQPGRVSSRWSGLVSKNGILIVEFANHLQETGLRQAAGRSSRRPARACGRS